MKRLLPAFFVLLLAVLACSIPGLPTDKPPVTKPPITEPPVTEPPLPTGPLPSGFVVAPDTTGIVFYAADGSVTGSLVTGDLGYIGPQSLHVAGGTLAGMPPVVYFTWRDSLPQLFLNTGGAETLLMYQPDFYRLGGAPGSSYIAYSTAAYADAGLLTRLYIGTPATIAAAAPAVDMIEAGGFGLKPLAMRMEGGAPTGIWYTGCLYGIGGDLVYDPCNRLTFLDLNTGVSSELVGDGYNPSQLSPDHTWVAYAQPGGGMPLTILNLQTGVDYTFPIWPANDRGSGDGVFSPDNAFVAWMEASGYRMDEPPTFHSVVRLGSTDGRRIGDYEGSFFDATAGFPVVWAEPVGWLDNDSVLIQVGGVDWHDSAVLLLDLSGAMTYLASGNFIGLTYP